MGVGFVPGMTGSDIEEDQRPPLGDLPSTGSDVEPLPGPIGAVPLSGEPTIDEVVKDWDETKIDETATADGSGATLFDLKKDLDTKLPGPQPGTTYWGKGGVKWTVSTKGFDGKPGTKNVLTLKGEFYARVPTWKDYGTGSAGAKTEWDRFVKQLKIHERQHVTIGKDKIAAVADALKGLTLGEAKKKLLEFDADLKKAQKDHDDTTNHGGDIDAVLHTDKG